MKASVLKPIFTNVEHRMVLRVLGHLSAADVETLLGVVGAAIG